MLQKNFLLYFFAIFFLLGCSNNSKNQENKKLKTVGIMKENDAKFADGTIMQIVRIKTNLSEEELLERARERENQFEALPGLVQKYYIKSGTEGEYGGIYIWDSVESLKAFKESELAKSIPKAYEVIETPSVEIVDILFQLRE